MDVICSVDNCTECGHNSFSIVGRGICLLTSGLNKDKRCTNYIIPEKGIPKWCPFKDKSFEYKGR